MQFISRDKKSQIESDLFFFLELGFLLFECRKMYEITIMFS